MTRYSDYLKSEAWRKKTDEVWKRDRGRCRRCGRSADDVHHLTYDRVYHESLDDLIMLCRPCHKMDHGRLDDPRDEYRQRNRQQSFGDRELSRLYRR